MDISSTGTLHVLDQTHGVIEVYQLMDIGSGTNNSHWGGEHLGGFEFCSSFNSKGVTNRVEYISVFGGLD